jgi:hypothetical protein
VVVDAFDVEAPIVSHLQETDPDVVYSASWTQDPSAAWSGGGVAIAARPATWRCEVHHDGGRQDHR